ncbi:acyltransferase family protein [Sinomonas sp. P10A9]|uniref:Acyltransferase family protein n=1 Tax=Sinomonas puerhi TaxID=3238584 RepID=A0AB39L0Y5_9MICC
MVFDPSSPSLQARLSARTNSLNAVRLFLALLVVIGHAWPLTGSLSGPHLEFLSDIAVNGFFAVSGYLIAASRVSTSLPVYLVRRILRIFPGFLVCLLAIALVFSPLAAALEHRPMDWLSAAGFVIGNALLAVRQWGIGQTLGDVPYPSVWDGSLWTLGYEFVAYLALGAVLTVPWIRSRMGVVLTALALMSIAGWMLIEGPVHVSTSFYHYAGRLGSYFLVGAAMYAAARRIPVRTSLIAAAAASYVALWYLGADGSLGQVPLAYLLLAVGSRATTGVTTRNDLSYGLYIYAFPVQQLLVDMGTAPWGVLPNAVATLAIALGLAWLSWRLIEKPALSLKNLRPGAGIGLAWTRSARTDRGRLT